MKAKILAISIAVAIALIAIIVIVGVAVNYKKDEAGGEACKKAPHQPLTQATGQLLKRREVNAVFGHRDCAYNAQRSPRAAKQYTVLF